jgi:hypothetical protein
MEVPAALFFLFDGEGLIREKAYFDQATVARSSPQGSNRDNAADAQGGAAPRALAVGALKRDYKQCQ